MVTVLRARYTSRGDADEAAVADDGGEGQTTAATPSGSETDQTIRNRLYHFIASLYGEQATQGAENIAHYGHQLTDLIQECNWVGMPCNMTTDWDHSQHPVYGNCYTFNSGEHQPVKMIGRTGSLHGLSLTLYIEQDEYIGRYAQSAGVVMSLHPANTHGFPEQYGIDLAPGLETSVGLHVKKVFRLSHPYGNCSHDGHNVEYFNSFHNMQYTLEVNP
ncbi:PREDICTED: amiloride-sensitive sodium channel subunit gamma-like [Priapulus caudatus]|uniref:Amiloride-sensitive sodium channel subunit gamma-like n=1 Tax=Priapulus caudatus TaxID=37621 RepID=A0ABM1EBP9_PRICU|nr:PREDICTED: amiloride-sensitive sodium channel subunit gamma-like [Priapulus caudatus]